MRVEVTFRNGVTIKFRAKNVKTTRNTITGRYTEMTWDKPRGRRARILHTLDVNEVLAVVVQR